MSKLTFKSNQTHPVTPTSTSKTNGRLLLPLAVLTTSLLALSCKGGGDADASSREGSNNREAADRAGQNADARSAKVSAERTTPLSAEDRANKYKDSIRKAVMGNQGSEADREKAFNKAMQDWVNDPVLFGERRYASADQVKDKKVDFYLPGKATRIRLLKEANGHHALYKISEEDFKAHLEQVWKRYREDFAREGESKWIKYSEEAIARALQGSAAAPLKFVTHKQAEENGYPWNGGYVRVPQAVIDSAWQAPQDTVKYSGPVRSNGGMVTWYYDRDAGVAFQDVGYW